VSAQLSAERLGFYLECPGGTSALRALEGTPDKIPLN
jgi:hypothetical protein